MSDTIEVDEPGALETALNGGAPVTPADAGLRVIVRLDVPLSSLDRPSRDGYFQAVGKAVQEMMPPGPDPDGRGLFFLLMPTPDDDRRPYPYVTNADRSTLAPVLGLLAGRLAQDDPERLTSAETVIRTLRRLSDAVEAYAADYDVPGSVREEFDAARTDAIRVLDALEPESIIDTRPDRSHHGEETPQTPGGGTGDDQDRGSDVPGEVVRPDAGTRPAPGDAEPFRPRPCDDAV